LGRVLRPTGGNEVTRRAILVVALFLAGCGKREPAEGVGGAAPDVRNEAAEAALAAGKDAPAERAAELKSALQELLESGDVESAEKRYLAEAAEGEEAARAGFGMVYSYYWGKNDHAALAAWTAKLKELPLPNDLSVRAFVLHVDGLVAADECEGLAQAVPECVSRFETNLCARILSYLMASALQKTECDIGSLLAVVESSAGETEVLRNVVTAFRTDLLMKQELWEDAEKQFREAGTEVSDAELAALVARVVPVALAKNQRELAERFCEWVLANQPDKERARREAGSQRLAVIKQGGSAEDAVGGFRSLMDRELEPAGLVPVYADYFYFVVHKGSNDNVKAMMDMGEKLRAMPVGGKYDGWLRQLALDGCFVLEDYEKAMELLRQGIPERDQEWRQMAMTKVKAHLALQQGNNEEAIENFRKFMEYVGKWKEPELDPSTGMRHTRNMTLGRNAKRIGDIYRAMGKKEEARKVYDEASEYYKAAVPEVKRDGPEFRHLMEELTKIPADPLI